jgi:hypothetical protein
MIATIHGHASIHSDQSNKYFGKAVWYFLQLTLVASAANRTVNTPKPSEF